MKTTKKINSIIGITNIKLECEQNDNTKIKKIKFETGNDNEYISWKPKVKESEFRNGFELVVIKPLDFGKIPPFIKQLAQIIRKKGSVTINADYYLMKVDDDGDLKEYRFIKYESDLNKWKIIPELEEQNGEK